jgi:hypothetical protein
MPGLNQIEPRTKPEFQSLNLASVVKFTMAAREELITIPGCISTTLNFLLTFYIILIYYVPVSGLNNFFFI